MAYEDTYTDYSAPAYESTYTDPGSYASGYDYGGMYTDPANTGTTMPPSWMGDPNAKGNPPWSQPAQQLGQGMTPQQIQMMMMLKALGMGGGGFVDPRSNTQAIGGLLGALGPLAGLIGGIASGGVQRSQNNQLPFQGQVAGNQAQGSLSALAQQGANNTPLQQMQTSLLQALQSGQGLPPGYQRLIEQAYQPQMGNIATQAIESARNRGFAGGADLLNSGPGGAIAGPALADLQGQMAQSKLGLMQSLPQLYNTPIQNQGAALQQGAQGYTNLANMYGNQAGRTSQSIPMGQQVGQGIGNVMTGAYGGMNSANQQAGNQNFQNMMMKAIQGMSGGQPDQSQGGMDFSQMYGQPT